ncbi:conjugal transfer protein [Bartonella gliris]|uniref:conjugal transfer protein n=1 Tax=Bartonella gliris TaxID=3004109 RepID=UPI0038732AEE
MKKLAIIAIISVTLTMPSLALGQKSSISVTYQPAQSFDEDSVLSTMEYQLEYLKKIYGSITGIKKRSSHLNHEDSNLFFSKPRLIYDKVQLPLMDPQIPSLIQKIKKDEDSFLNGSVNNAREAIDNRRQYAEIIDKAVDSRLFVHNKFHSSLLEKRLKNLAQIEDLKGTAQSWAYIETMLSTIENENIKLETIAHSRDVEQALIKLLQYKRNSKILRYANKQMPTIRSQ